MIYPSIRIEGAILSPDILDRLDDLAGQRPVDFGLEGTAKVKDEIARAWADAQDYWRIFQRKLDATKADEPKLALVQLLAFVALSKNLWPWDIFVGASPRRSNLHERGPNRPTTAFAI